MGHVIENDGRERTENRAAVDGSLPWEPDLTYKVSLCRWRGEGVPMVLKQGQEPSIWETCVLGSRVASLSTLCLWDNLCMFPGMIAFPILKNSYKPLCNAQHYWHLLPSVLKRNWGTDWMGMKDACKQWKGPLTEYQPSPAHRRYPQFPGETPEGNFFKWLQIAPVSRCFSQYLPCSTLEKKNHLEENIFTSLFFFRLVFQAEHKF